jgi:hypothetical protein
MMRQRDEGLTRTYNGVHDPGDKSVEIIRLRELHVDLDYTVRDAYGWTDLDLGHDFYDTRLGVRYTFEPVVRQEILDRLLELNHERYAGELAAGLHAQKQGPARSRARREHSAQTAMFGDG